MRPNNGKGPTAKSPRSERDSPFCSFFGQQARRWLGAMALGPVEFERTHVTAGPTVVVPIDGYSVDSSRACGESNAAGDLMRLAWNVRNIIVLPNHHQTIQACPGINGEYGVIAASCCRNVTVPLLGDCH